MSDDSVKKITDYIKSWLPIVVSIGGLITGYFVFKSETKYQFEMQTREIRAVQAQINTIKEDIDENKKDWQREVELQLQLLREVDIRQDMRIRILENQPL